ncbi:MAG: hypothetical protein ACOH5I_21765 [Oligoflexus sp.]
MYCRVLVNLLILFPLLVELFEPSSSFIRIDTKPRKFIESKSVLLNPLESNLDIRKSSPPELCINGQPATGDESDSDEEDEVISIYSLVLDQPSYRVVLDFTPYHEGFFYIASPLDMVFKPLNPPPILS